MSSERALALSDGEIHLWLADYAAIGDVRLHEAYRALMSPAEREQEQRFYFERDRNRYLVTRALVRSVLSRYVAIAPEALTFENNAYGRPALSHAGARALSFNLSHTHSLIVLAVANGREVGVDVENHRTREVSLDLARHYFAPPEVAALETVPEHEQQYRFFEYWTFKESYIKARGMGLSLPLDQFSFHYGNDDAVELHVDPSLADDPHRWLLWQFRPSPDYLVALCAERTGAEVPRISMRCIVPLLDETTLIPRALRCSAGAAPHHEYSLQGN